MIKRILLIAIISIFLLLIFQSQFYGFKTAVKIPDHIKKELFQLGEKALQSKDVPIASVLTYEGKIIGRGYNTVKRDSNIGGHAEINAISDAYKRYGERFSKLDRDKLVLYSTFEPCEMCKGAMIHYNIKKMVTNQHPAKI